VNGSIEIHGEQQVERLVWRRVATCRQCESTKTQHADCDSSDKDAMRGGHILPST